MRLIARRILSLMLVLCLVAMPLAGAAEVTDDGHVIRDPERLEQFTFPGNWSDDALKFCVGNGIMNGRGSDLAADANTTRAETAALLVRLLGAKTDEPDLSQFRDVEKKAWYYAELATAVELGIMNGTSKTTLAPNASITREQVFTLISRAFGLYPEDPKAYRQFSDGLSCSAYARNAVSALRELGILNGYSDGSVRPGRYITRAELAQLLYQLFTCVCDDPADLPESGSVLYRGKEPIPEGYVLDGRLTVGCGWDADQSITGVTVTERLTLRTVPGITVSMSACSIGQLSLPGQINVSSDQRVEQVTVAGAGSVVNVPAGICDAYTTCTVESDVEHLSCRGEGSRVTLNGNAQSCQISARKVTLDGSGYVEQLELTKRDSEILISCGTVLEPELSWEDVETLVVWDTVTEDTWLYESSNLTGRIRELPAGTKLEHYYYHEGRAAASVYTEDGRFGYADIDCISIPEEADILDEPYPDEVMEDFVNHKGYTSDTDYLIWVSLKTQTVNIFQGSKGAWTLTHSMPCASGKNSTPTVRGTFSTHKKLQEWNFGTYKVRYVTVFYEGYAFHSRVYSPDYSTMLDDAISYPASDGCLRMLDEDCKFIMEKIPMRTRVVVY